jgi:hypothetical protein
MAGHCTSSQATTVSLHTIILSLGTRQPELVITLLSEVVTMLPGDADVTYNSVGLF